MRIHLAAIAALSFTVAANADPVHFDLKDVPVTTIVQQLYQDVLRVPYVSVPAPGDERRLATVRIDADDDAGARDQAYAYLGALGFQARRANGFDLVVARPAAPSVYVYHPRYRDSSYILEALRPAMGGVTAGTSAASVGSIDGPAGGEQAAAAGSPGGNISKSVDSIVFSGPPEDLAKIRALLASVDYPLPQLSVKATVYEVSSTQQDGSAAQLAIGLLSSRYGVEISMPQGGGNNAIHFKGPGFEAVASALSTDARFRVVTAPSVRAKSGTQTVFNSGSQVPVLGAVTLQGAAGNPVQSVDYRDSGVIFKVKPTVKRSIIDLEIEQEISSFVETTTGVNTSPTLLKRSLKSSLGVNSGEVIVLGGLTQDKKTNTKNSFFGFLPIEDVYGSDRTEILIVLQVARIDERPDPRVLPRPVADVAATPSRRGVIDVPGPIEPPAPTRRRSPRLDLPRALPVAQATVRSGSPPRRRRAELREAAAVLERER
jgi:general secretion pathway protein D